jgi:ABC-type amino acid transport substrate-binding protein
MNDFAAILHDSPPAHQPTRRALCWFTAPYILIEGSYLVREDSMLQTNEEVDGDGVRVMVGKGSAYDLFLTRELRRATIVRADTSPSVVDEFIAQQVEVAAGVRQQLAADAARLPRLRLLRADPAGDGTAAQQGQRGSKVSRTLCRGDEGDRLCRRGDVAACHSRGTGRSL